MRILYDNQYGGSLFNANQSVITHIKTFIENANKIVKLTDKALYGMNYKISIPKNGSYKSPFYSSEMNTFGNPVNSILMKFVLISQGDQEEQYEVNDKIKYTMLANDFINEIKVQQTLYTQSSYLGAPVTVSIIAGIDSAPNDVLMNILGKTKSRWNDLLKIIDYGKQKGYDVGIICMEFLDTYQTIDEYIYDKYDDLEVFNNEKLESVIGLIGYTYLRIFSLGYIHYDSHTNNIMIDTTANDYLAYDNDRPSKGRIIFIDYGRVQKVEKGARWDPWFENILGDIYEDVVNETNELLNKVEFTNKYLSSFYKMVNNWDIGKNSIFNLYNKVHEDDNNNKIVPLTMDIINKRNNMIRKNYKEGIYEPYTSSKKVELLNLQKVNKMSNIINKKNEYNYNDKVYYLNQDRAHGVKMNLDEVIGIDTDMMLLCKIVKNIGEKSECMKYIMLLYYSSIAPKSIIERLILKRVRKSCKKGKVRSLKTNKCIKNR